MKKSGFENPNEMELTSVRALAVDDDADSRYITSMALADFGATVKTADSAEAALTCLRSFQPDVLLLDISMPNVDGFELLKRIRTLPSDNYRLTPAIALTAHVHAPYQQQAMSIGFQAYLIKPIDLFELADTVLKVASSQTLDSSLHIRS